MAQKKRRAKRARQPGAIAVPVHPLVAQALANGAQLDRGKFEVAKVENPYGEVLIRGEMRRHNAVRRVPHFEALYRSKVIDRNVFVCLEWYAERLAVLDGGMFKSALDDSGGSGGNAASHIPTNEARMMALSDLEWARGFIPQGDAGLVQRRVFDRVMNCEETFEQVAPHVFPQLCLDRGKRKASSAFKIAANYLLLGIGPRVIGMVE